MTTFTRDELERAFQCYWRTGAVGEDWDKWADLFTEDADYVEHVLGNLKGREAIRAWIKPIMVEYCELYTVYEWHMVDEATGRVVVHMQNPTIRAAQGRSTFPASLSSSMRATTGGAARTITGPCRKRMRRWRSTRRPASSLIRTTNRSARVWIGATVRRGHAVADHTQSGRLRRNARQFLCRMRSPDAGEGRGERDVPPHPIDCIGQNYRLHSVRYKGTLYAQRRR